MTLRPDDRITLVPFFLHGQTPFVSERGPWLPVGCPIMPDGFITTTGILPSPWKAPLFPLPWEQDRWR